MTKETVGGCWVLRTLTVSITKRKGEGEVRNDTQTQRRAEGAMRSIEKKAEGFRLSSVTNFDEMSLDKLVETYNEMVLTAIDLGLRNFETVRRFINTSVGRAKCRALHKAIQDAIAKQIKPRKTCPAKEGGAEGKRAVALDSRMIALVGENPLTKPETRERFAAWMEGDGITVRQYARKFPRNSRSESEARALRDARWAVAKGYLKVDDSKGKGN